MLFMKKGQSLSLNTIIIAAIGLVVLVLLVVLVVNAFDKTSTGTACESTGGSCINGLDGELSISQLNNECRTKLGNLASYSPASCGKPKEGEINACCVGLN